MTFYDPTLYGRDEEEEFGDSGAYTESLEEDFEEEEEEEESGLPAPEAAEPVSAPAPPAPKPAPPAPSGHFFGASFDGAPAGGVAGWSFTISSSSTSNWSVEPGLIFGGAPRSP